MNNEQRRSKEKIINLEIYTDGSLKRVGRNITFGAWGFIVVQDGHEIYEASGSEYGTTNQRMELEAVIQALNYIITIRRPNENVAIYSDSAYIINCYNQEWYAKWMVNGWVNSKNENVANRDQWQRIIPYFDNFWYTFKKVPAHADVYWNERCDKLVQDTAERLRIEWRGEQNHERKHI